MNYFVPAWHKQLNDWAYSQPTIEFDDAVSHMRILQDNNERVGVVLTDYQPQLTTKLNQLALFPDRVWSAFDYLQGINTLESQTIDIRDLNWPVGAYFNLNAFNVFVIVGDQLYATVSLDVQSKILSIDYHAGDLAGSQLLLDSRGFVSRQIKGNQEIYFDQQGNWRLKHDRQTDQVIVNQELVQTEQVTYHHMSELLEEVVVNHFLPEIHATDNLVVTTDDNATIDLRHTFDSHQPIYSISRWHPFEREIKGLSGQRIIVDTEKTKRLVQQQISKSKQLSVLPLFQSQFKLGHSQRLSEQRVAIFAEYMTDTELMTMLDDLYPRMIKDPSKTALYLFSYSGEKAGMVNQVFSRFRKKHDGDFILSLDEIDPGENQLDAEEIPPILKIKQERLVSNAQVLTALDKIRLMVMWGQADEFMSMATVSVGIPVLQNFESSEIVDHHNGLICHNWDDFKQGIKYYLDSLKNWNQSLVYNVQVMNKYSEDNLYAGWQQYLKGDEK